MFNFDTNKLRRQTQDAIQKAREKLERSDRKKAEHIIKQIPKQCADAARDRQSTAVIMNLNWRVDFVLPQKEARHRPCESCLVGAAKLVWEHCVNSGLKAELQYGRDNSLENIILCWDTKGRGAVIAKAGEFVIAKTGDFVIAESGSFVIAQSGSSVNAKSGSNVSAMTGSNVAAESGSNVSAMSGSTVTAESGSNVSAMSGSNVTAKPGSNVTTIGDRT